jgi:uncharacterized FlgJ-related protein
MKKLIKILLLLILTLPLYGQAHKIDSTINAVLVAHKIPHYTRKLIIAQAKFESGNYTNKLAKRHNNLFGMMHPRKRLTRSMGPLARAEGRPGYAVYASIEDSVEDMLFYLWDKKQTPRYKSSEEYVRFLKKNRFFAASEEHYLKGLRYYLKEL